MNSNWRNRPTTIDHIPRTIKQIIAIDESGNSSLKQVLKCRRNGEKAADSEQFFTVTACVIKMNDFDITRDMVMNVKNKHWKDGLSIHKGKVKRVCFHSRDIRGKRGAFCPDLINYDDFRSDISKLICNLPIELFASCIDKYMLVNKYRRPFEPYDLCLHFVIERIMFNMKDSEKCIIMLESRGKKEDRKLLNYIKKLIDCGTKYSDKSVFSKIKGVYFNPKWCRMKDDKMSYWELELADLCAYPIQKYFMYGEEDRAFEVVKTKIHKYPNIDRYGLKKFP